MKKFLAVLLVALGLLIQGISTCLSAVATEDHSDAIVKAYQEVFRDPETRTIWANGLFKEHHIVLAEINLAFTQLAVETNGDQTFVAGYLHITLLGYQDKDKVRVKIVRQIIVLLNAAGECIAAKHIGQQAGPVEKGWVDGVKI